MTLVMRSRWLAVLLACCSSAPTRSPARPAKPENKCAFVADHLMTLLTDTAKAAPVEELDRVRQQFHTRCKEDGWSPAAQKCFLGLASKGEVDRCASELTESQHEALEHGALSK
jgi:hypothetical protein